MTIKERFERKVNKTDSCWLWIASISDCGYGRFMVDGENRTAHRVSWELNVGVIPQGKQVLHKCDVRNCVNPDHLFLGTHIDNMADMVRKGRGADRLGSKNNKSKLSEVQVLEIRQSIENEMPVEDIIKKFNITSSHLWLIKNKRIWKNLI